MVGVNSIYMYDYMANLLLLIYSNENKRIHFPLVWAFTCMNTSAASIHVPTTHHTRHPPTQPQLPTSHQTPSYTTTATHITPDTLLHNHSYPHHTRCPQLTTTATHITPDALNSQPQLPKSHLTPSAQITATHIIPDTTSTQPQLGLNHSAYSIPSWACPDLSVATLRSTCTCRHT